MPQDREREQRELPHVSQRQVRVEHNQRKGRLHRQERREPEEAGRRGTGNLHAPRHRGPRREGGGHRHGHGLPRRRHQAPRPRPCDGVPGHGDHPRDRRGGGGLQDGHRVHRPGGAEGRVPLQVDPEEGDADRQPTAGERRRRLRPRQGMDGRRLHRGQHSPHPHRRGLRRLREAEGLWQRHRRTIAHMQPRRGRRMRQGRRRWRHSQRRPELPVVRRQGDVPPGRLWERMRLAGARHTRAGEHNAPDQRQGRPVRRRAQDVQNQDNSPEAGHRPRQAA